MSGSTAKAERRDIRRALGENGLAAVGQLELDVRKLEGEISTLKATYAIALGSLDLPYLQFRPLIDRMKLLEETIARMDRDQLARERTRWTRLRWVLCRR